MELDLPPAPVAPTRPPVAAFVPLPLQARDTGTTWENTLRERLEARRQMRARAASGIFKPPAIARSDAAALLHLVWGFVLLGLRRGGWLALVGLCRVGRAVSTRVGRAAAYANGWRLWYVRKLRTDPDTRLATFGLLAGLIVPLLVFALLTRLFPPAPGAVPAPPLDPSVPPPQLTLIEALPGEGVIMEPSMPMQAAPMAPVARTFSPATFRFEQFVRLQADGRVMLLGQTVQKQLRTWYPTGSPAASALRFFGSVVQRADGGETLSDDAALKLAQRHCLHMPANKLFTKPTIACTYRHAMPARASFPPASAFWIMALSYDRAGNLTELGVYAREAFVASTPGRRGRS